MVNDCGANKELSAQTIQKIGLFKGLFVSQLGRIPELLIGRRLFGDGP